jgi:ubiquinone/menaquinone biosynthesis C-methylase UbiE
MAEISRVLKPGGVFVASTFLTPLAPLGELIGDSTVRPLSQVGNLAVSKGLLVSWQDRHRSG